MFAPYLDLWDLTSDGAPIVTHAAWLLPVRRKGEALMLKVSTEADDPAVDLAIAALAVDALDG